jgi:hypothetical protein
MIFEGIFCQVAALNDLSDKIPKERFLMATFSLQVDITKLKLDLKITWSHPSISSPKRPDRHRHVSVVGSVDEMVSVQVSRSTTILFK